MAKRERPLSPFFNYRWQYSNTLSLLHRLTGIFLSAGLVLLIYWLMAAASTAEVYAKAQGLFANRLISLLLIGLTFSFFYHFFNGLRHLAWDLGHGFDRKVARASGWTAFVGALVFTVLCWILIALHVSGNANGAGGLV
jgi:succinate dehydrogenase / fumarate reductase cytochrome b subunit